MRIVILGAGGHAQVIADAIRRGRDSSAPLELVGFLDDNPETWGSTILGAAVLGGNDRLGEIEHDCVIVGIGNNRTRRLIYERLHARGERFATVIHPAATIADDVTVGEGCVIFAGAVVNTGSQIGANVILNTGCSVDHHNRIGDHAHIAPGSHLGGNVEVGAGAFVGIGATVLPQTRLGAWCTVGAGAVAVGPVDEGVTVVGVPARPLWPR